MAVLVQQRLPFAILVLCEKRWKNSMPVSDQKLRMHVIHACMLYSNE